MIQLVAFLGNFGKEYENTRHNTAWLFEESLPFSSRISWSAKYKSDFCSADFSDFVEWLKSTSLIKTKEDGSTSPAVPKDAPKKIYFMKPLTYMNLSGEAVAEAAHFFKIPPSDILIVHDEIELPLGTVSLKWSGGLGGHNGLRSLKASLGTADFWRLRFGVGKPANGDIANYVLGSFSQDEKIMLSQIFDQTHSLFASLFLSKDPERFISEWRKKKLV